MIRKLIYSLVVSLHAVVPVQAVVTSDEPGSHIASPGEVSYGINPDGVVIVGGLRNSEEAARICTGALITDRHVMSAAHCFDSDGNGEVDPGLSFFPHEIVFDLPEGLVAIQYDLESIQFPASWPDSRADLAVVELAQDAPSNVPRYPLYGGHDDVGRPFVLIAYGEPGHGASGFDDTTGEQPTQRAGRNRYEAIRNDEGTDFLAYDFDSGLEFNNALAELEFESDLGFGADEVFSATGDSGGPTFIGGAIAGVTAWGGRLPATDVTSELDSSWGELGFDTRVSSFRDFIQTATGGAALFVLDGDFNKNGSVDGSDFLLWQRQFGENDYPAADGNGDGVAGAADYLIWQDNLGGAIPPSSTPTAASTVPEPSAAILLGLAVLTLGCQCRSLNPLVVRAPTEGPFFALNWRGPLRL